MTASVRGRIMSSRKQRLELTWIGKDERPRLEPRILLEDEEKSYHAKAHVTDHDIFDNILIHGDNLLALKALEQQFIAKVNCIYIDPPFNTGQAFEHYDDGVEHSLWLSLMRDRLELLKTLLADNGTMFILTVSLQRSAWIADTISSLRILRMTSRTGRSFRSCRRSPVIKG
jgi:adenine-specific DNA-methyltransferase